MKLPASLDAHRGEGFDPALAGVGDPHGPGSSARAGILDSQLAGHDGRGSRAASCVKIKNRPIYAFVVLAFDSAAKLSVAEFLNFSERSALEVLVEGDGRLLLGRHYSRDEQTEQKPPSLLVFMGWLREPEPSRHLRCCCFPAARSDASRNWKTENRRCSGICRWSDHTIALLPDRKTSRGLR